MRTGWMTGLSPYLKLLMILVITIASAMLITIFCLILAIPIFGLEEIMALTQGRASISILKFLQIVQSFSIFIIPSFLAALILSRKPLKWLRFGKIELRSALTVIFILLAAQPLTGLLGYLNMQMSLPSFLSGWETWMASAESNANALIFQFLETSSPTQILINVFMIVLLPAFGEELLFRGTIQPTLKKIVKNDHVAVWITAFLFSAMHMQFFTFAPRLFLGALLGYLLVYSKRIWYPIIGHLINNLLSLIIFYYLRVTQPDINPLDASSDRPDIWMVIASTLLMIGLFGLFKNKMKWSFGTVSSRSK